MRRETLRKAIPGLMLFAVGVFGLNVVPSNASPPAPTLESIMVSGCSIPKYLIVGVTGQCIAIGFYSDGSAQDITRSVTWTSDDPSVVSVNPTTGVTTGVAAGHANITATQASITSDSDLANATTGTLQSIFFVPNPGAVAVGSALHVLALGTYSIGPSTTTPVNLTNVATWTSSNTSLATVDSTGAITGVAAGGPVTITAAYQGTSADVHITVVPSTPGWKITGNPFTYRNPGFTATLLPNGKVLIAGATETGAQPFTIAELYDPTSGTFSPTGSMSVQREGCTATLLNDGTVLVAGGESTVNPTAFLSTAEVYDPATGVFTLTTGTMNSARAGHTATLLNNGMVLIAGGEPSDGTETSSAELYNPATGLFTVTGSLSTARSGAAAALLNNGEVLITGGASGGPPATILTSAEIYNPATGTFSAAGDMATGRTGHQATTLGNGMVLICGGTAAAILAQNGTNSELYDPATNSFSATGPLQNDRLLHTAILLSNGTVLVVGGINYSLVPTPTAEIYDPASGTFSFTASPLYGYTGPAVMLADGSVLLSGKTVFAVNPPRAEIYTPTATSATLQAIAVTPASPTLSKGSSQQFTAIGTYSDSSTQNITSSVTWASQTQGVATFSTTTPGFATAVGTGTSQITAKQGGVTSPAITLTVNAATLASISVTPASPSIAKGATQQFTATGHYTDASTEDITAAVTWTSQTLSVATFSPSTPGLATGVSTGTSQITASLSGVTSSPDVLTVTALTLVSVAVTPASPSIAKGQTQQFTATGKYSDNSTQDITASVTWISQTLSVATFGAPNGLATGVGAGTSQITASMGGVTSPADVLTVTAATLVSIAVTPANPAILVGGTQAFTATGTYTDNSIQNVTASATWASASTSVATINATTGVATGVSGGTAQITAKVGSITSPNDTLTVDNPSPSIVNLSPSHSAAGAAFTLTVNGTNFVNNSTVSFNGKTETTTYANATQLTAAIPAADVALGATVNVTATNPTPGGGTSAAASFTIDDFTIAGPGAPVSVTPGQPTPVAISIDPSVDGFANAVQLSASGLPKGMSAQFSQNPVTPGSSPQQITMMVTATARAALPLLSRPRKFPAEPMALVISLLCAALLVAKKRAPRGALQPARSGFVLRIALVAGIALLLAGCAGGFPLNTNVTPAGNYTVTVTGTSGTVQHSTTVALSVQ